MIQLKNLVYLPAEVRQKAREISAENHDVSKVGKVKKARFLKRDGA
jgi:hypothetical protein